MLVMVELAQWKYVVEGDWAQDLGSDTKLEDLLYQSDYKTQVI
jgi:hypothetical protein